MADTIITNTPKEESGSSALLVIAVVLIAMAIGAVLYFNSDISPVGGNVPSEGVTNINVRVPAADVTPGTDNPASE